MMDTNETSQQPAVAGAVKKVDTINRYLAKFVDFLLILTLVTFLPALLAFLTALTYLSIADGFRGQSLGKRLIGLKVMEIKEGVARECGFRASVVRNSPLALALFFSSIPLLGLPLMLTAVPIIVAAEAYFVWTDERGARLGDILASTLVQQAKEETEK